MPSMSRRSTTPAPRPSWTRRRPSSRRSRRESRLPTAGSSSSASGTPRTSSPSPVARPADTTRCRRAGAPSSASGRGGRCLRARAAAATDAVRRLGRTGHARPRPCSMAMRSNELRSPRGLTAICCGCGRRAPVAAPGTSRSRRPRSGSRPRAGRRSGPRSPVGRAASVIGPASERAEQREHLDEATEHGEDLAPPVVGDGLLDQREVADEADAVARTEDDGPDAAERRYRG